MAQINLLKQPNTSTTNIWTLVPKVLVRVLLVVLVLLIAYYGFLFFQSKKLDTEVSTTLIQVQNDQQQILSVPGRAEVLTRQSQLKNLTDIINQHIYWSQIFPKIAQATLKNATYSNLRTMEAGQISLSVTVPSLEDLEKFLQVFDLPDVNKYFSNVKISSYHKVQQQQDGKSTTAITFEVTFNYNAQIIQYNGN